MAQNKTGGFRYGQRKLTSYVDPEPGFKVDHKNQSPLAKAARAALKKLPQHYKESLHDLIVRINSDQDPPWIAPYHLQDLVNVFDRIQKGEPVKVLLSVPPQHAKSLTICHGILRYLMTHRNKKVVYVSYNQDLAEKASKDIRDRLPKVGLNLSKDSTAIGSWKLTNGCTFRATALVHGNLSGYPADLIVVDDPYKDRAEVESGTIREKVYSAYQTAVLARAAKHIIVLHTRWHEDDLIGKLSKTGAYEYINIPAINGAGEALWPEVRPLSFLEGVRSEQTVYDWSALYMGNPVPKGASLFGDIPETNYYTKLPDGLVYSVGIDLAYTAKTHADYSVAVILGTDGRSIYVVDVVRKQCDASSFLRHLETLRSQYPKAPFASYISGPEKGAISLLNSRPGINIIGKVTNNDKFVRAQGASAAWNAGKIFLPTQNVHWKNSFVSEVTHFSGLSDPQDDQVDALAAAYDALTTRRSRRDLSLLSNF